jgi:hypothetical protein
MLVALTPFAYAQAGMQRRALLSTLGPLLLMMAVAQGGFVLPGLHLFGHIQPLSYLVMKLYALCYSC